MFKPTNTEDILGHAVHDYFRTGKNKKIKVLSSITSGEYLNSSYLFREYDQMPLIEKKALELCSGVILDVGACAGSQSLYLQNIGKSVTALEQSALCCEVMINRGVVNVKNIDFYDYTGEKYDTILLLMNGIGIAGTVSGLEQFLVKCKDLLTDKGKVIFDSSDINYMFQEEDGSQWVDLNNEYYGEVNYQFKYKKGIGEKFNWLFIDYNTLKAHAQKSGFKTNLIVKGNHHDYLAELRIS